MHLALFLQMRKKTFQSDLKRSHKWRKSFFIFMAPANQTRSPALLCAETALGSRRQMIQLLFAFSGQKIDCVDCAYAGHSKSADLSLPPPKSTTDPSDITSPNGWAAPGFNPLILALSSSVREIKSSISSAWQCPEPTGLGISLSHPFLILIWSSRMLTISSHPQLQVNCKFDIHPLYPSSRLLIKILNSTESKKQPYGTLPNISL